MSRTTFYQQRYVDWPPVPVTEYANPESTYWQERALAAFQLLEGRIGRDAADAWEKATWPQGINDSWKVVHEKVYERLHDVHSLAESEGLQ